MHFNNKIFVILDFLLVVVSFISVVFSYVWYYW